MMGTALVTGATGFLGGRLVERLVVERGVRVRVALRDFARAARLSRFNIQMRRAELTDPEAVGAALRGCDSVYHCAHDFFAPDVNLVAARTIAQACLASRVRRLVYVSSFAIYQPFADDVVDEATPVRPTGWSYQDSKIVIENELLRMAQKDGLPVTILEPTIVYGPFGAFWTSGPIEFLRHGRVLLPADGRGLCNAVYVDDVVDAMLASAERDAAVGERLLVSAECPVTWHEYFRAHERALGTQSIVLLPTEKLRQAERWGRPRRLGAALQREPWRTAGLLAAKVALRPLRPALKEPISRRLVNRPLPWKMLIPDAQQLSMYLARPTVRIEKARRILGYRPAFDFASGMSLMCEYIAWARL